MPFPGGVDGPRAVDVAVGLALAERIGARVPSAVLEHDLGRDAARRLMLARLKGLVPARSLGELLPELVGALCGARIPVILLKFAGLQAGGHLLERSRVAGDLDLLIREADAGPARQLLVGRGFTAFEPTLADHHHLPTLQDRQGRPVELHTRLPGLRAPGARRFAGFAALAAAGALRAAPGLGPGCHVLQPDFMAAHAVAHGLVQHGGADVYPLTRLLADLADLLPPGRRRRGIAAREWIAADVPPARLEAVLGLCDALELGDLDGLAARPAEAALLRHVVASALDPAYRRALAVGSLWRPLSDEPRWWRVLKSVQALALPTSTQLAARYGLPGSRHVGTRLRLRHALGLVRRLPELARAAARAALGGRRGPEAP